MLRAVPSGRPFSWPMRSEPGWIAADPGGLAARVPMARMRAGADSPKAGPPTGLSRPRASRTASATGRPVGPLDRRGVPGADVGRRCAPGRLDRRSAHDPPLAAPSGRSAPRRRGCRGHCSDASPPMIRAHGRGHGRPAHPPSRPTPRAPRTRRTFARLARATACRVSARPPPSPPAPARCAARPSARHARRRAPWRCRVPCG